MTACPPRAENTQCRMKPASHQLARPWLKIRMSKCFPLAPERAVVRRIGACMPNFLTSASPSDFGFRLSRRSKRSAKADHYFVPGHSFPRLRINLSMNCHKMPRACPVEFHAMCLQNCELSPKKMPWACPMESHVVFLRVCPCCCKARGSV